MGKETPVINSNLFSQVTMALDQLLEETKTFNTKGKVLQVVGTIRKAMVPNVKVGKPCILRTPWEETEVSTEVVGFEKQAVILTPLGELMGVSSATEVIPTGDVHKVGVSHDLLGRIVDGLGRVTIESIQDKGDFIPETQYPGQRSAGGDVPCADCHTDIARCTGVG
jgi:type III secretion protein N (ATPase)